MGRLIDAVPADVRNSTEFSSIANKARRHSVTVAYLSYLPFAAEAGPERCFDYSRESIAQRWSAGAEDVGVGESSWYASTNATPVVLFFPRTIAV